MKTYFVAMIATMFLVLSACEQKQAGIEKEMDKVDDALDLRPVEKARDMTEDISDVIDDALDRRTGEKVPDAAEDVRDEIKDAYKQKMAAQLKEWSAQINLLEAKLENIGADLKVKRTEELHELRTKYHAASEKMKELEKANGGAWEQVKETTDKIWDDLKAGLASAHSKFK